jgi:hypothetical protein
MRKRHPGALEPSISSVSIAWTMETNPSPSTPPKFQTDPLPSMRFRSHVSCGSSSTVVTRRRRRSVCLRQRKELDLPGRSGSLSFDSFPPRERVNLSRWRAGNPSYKDGLSLKRVYARLRRAMEKPIMGGAERVAADGFRFAQPILRTISRAGCGAVLQHAGTFTQAAFGGCPLSGKVALHVHC